MDYSIRDTSAVSSAQPSFDSLPAPQAVHAIEQQIRGKRWNDRAIDKLKEWDEKLEKAMPNNTVQQVLDDFGKEIDKLLARPRKLSAWIDSNGYGAWYKQFVNFACKLPLRAVRNLVRLVYNIVKATVYTFVHPIKAVNNAAKFLIQFLDALTKPITYTKMGAGVLGASLGHVAISGGFGLHAYIGLGLGGGLLICGLTAGAILSFAQAEKGRGLHDAAAELWKHAKTVPEFMLTGFLLGVILGGISKCFYKHKTVHKTETVTDTQTAKNYVDKQFLPKYNLPQPTTVGVDPSGKISVEWQGDALSKLAGNPYYTQAMGNKLGYYNPNTFKIELLPHSYAPTEGLDPTNVVTIIDGDTFWRQVVRYDMGMHYPSQPLVSQVTTATQVAVPAPNTGLAGLTVTHEGGS